jgi:hypothetical protein
MKPTNMRAVWPVLLFALGCFAAAAIAWLRLPGPVRPPPMTFTMVGPEMESTARLVAKDRLARNLTEGRITLLETAAGIQHLDTPELRAKTRDAHARDSSDEEAYCRVAIEWAVSCTPSGRAIEVRRQLEEELQARLNQGPLRLSEPAPACRSWSTTASDLTSASAFTSP